MFWKELIRIVTIGILSLSIKLTEGSPCSATKIDLILAIDGSITIGYENYDKQIDFITSVISKLPVGSNVKVGMIQFSDRWSTRVELPLGSKNLNAESVIKAVRDMEYSLGFSTLTGKALKMAREQLFGTHSRHGVEKVILLITDGKPRDTITFDFNLQLLKHKVRMISIAVGTTDSTISGHKFITRSIASGFQYAFRSIYSELYQLVDDVAIAICTLPRPTKQERSITKKCFQEKRDILFVVDSSGGVNKTTFKKAIKRIADIIEGLDITPSIINVGLMQYSDPINTRLEFGLTQYTKMYKINQSLNSIVQTEGSYNDLGNALGIIDNEIFSDDRLSADDALVLFTNNNMLNKQTALENMRRLKNKGVHVLVIGMGDVDEPQELYKKLATYPSDVSNLNTAQTKLILGDVAKTICRRVTCEDKSEKAQNCVLKKQDILFMLDSSRKMGILHTKAKKYFAKVIKKLNIAVSNIHIGFMQFGGRPQYTIKLGSLKFEYDIRRRIMRAGRSYFTTPNIALALKEVNLKVFNKPTGGHRDDARDLIFIATLGKTYRRQRVQNEIKKLKKKGVAFSVLDVGSKIPERDRVAINIIHDLASGPREVHTMDFKQIWGVAQSIVDVECKEKGTTVPVSCFKHKRKVLFMLDTSRGPTNDKLMGIMRFVINITEQLYTDPSNIEVGVLLYSGALFNFYEIPVIKRPLQETLDQIRKLHLLRGWKNALGDALKFVDKEVFPGKDDNDNAERMVIVLSHSVLANPERAFRFSERLKRKGIKLMTILIHTKKLSASTNAEYKTLATSSTTAHSIDYDKLSEYHKDVVLSLCDLNKCPGDSTRKCTPRKQDIFMVVDSSRSIGEGIYPNLVRFIKRFVRKLDVAADRTNLGLIQASDFENTEYEMKLSQYTSLKDVLSVIDDMVYHSGAASYIGNAIRTAVKDNVFNETAGLRSNVDKILMLFTDGVFHDGILVKQMVTELKQRGVRVVVVGMGEQAIIQNHKTVLENIASAVSDVYLVNLNGNVLTIEGQINEVFQHVQTLDCINTYEAPVQCSPEIVDLFVALDGSRSIGTRNFKKVKEFLEKLASEFNIGEEKAHFGLMQYGSDEDTRIEFGLSAHVTNKGVKDAIRNLTFLQSHKTKTGLALSVVKNKVFNGKNGDRPNAPNVLIIFTDGSSHDIDTAYTQATLLKKSGTRIVGIGAGSAVNSFFHQLKKMASREDDAHKANYNKLSGVVEDLLDIVCI